MWLLVGISVFQGGEEVKEIIIILDDLQGSWAAWLHYLVKLYGQ